MVPTLTNSVATPTFDWNFGDGSPNSASQFPTHAYAAPGTYYWTVVVSVPGQSYTASGTLVIEPQVTLGISRSSNNDSVILSWPMSLADTMLQTSADLGISSPWQWVPSPPIETGGMLHVPLPASANRGFFRVARPW